jgi:hypothetical protein
LIVDFIGRLENLAGDFETVARRLSLARNAGTNEPVIAPGLPRVLQRRNRELVADFYRVDIEMFRYMFER